VRTVVDQQRSKGVLILTETQGENDAGKCKLYGLYDQRVQDVTEAMGGFALSRETKLAVVYSPGDK
jgi:hypothetical protein